MDKSQFTAQQTGELIPITSPFKDWAFVPDPLPPNWTFPIHLWPKLAEAKRLLGKLDGIGSTLPNPELLLRPLERREALTSSSLEGTYASPQELLLFELKPRQPKSSDDRANASLEVYNYGRALREGFSYLQERPFSLHMIRQLHAWLLDGVRGERRNPGQIREEQVHIGADRRFVPAPPERVQETLDLLQPALGSHPGDFDPLIWAYLTHYQFEAIHPFLDGNGRVGRLLLALMTWKGCEMSLPWLFMSPFFERYRDEYIHHLFQISADGRWEPWLNFCLTGTIEQATDAINKCSLLNELKINMHSRVTAGSARLHQIIDELFISPFVTVPRLRDFLDVTYPTAKSDVERLIQASVLEEVKGFSNPRFYTSSEILAIAYRETGDREAESTSEHAS